MPLHLTSTFPLTLTIDGEPVQLTLKRLEPDEVTWLQGQFAEWETRRSQPPNADDEAFLARCFEWVSVLPDQIDIDGVAILTGAQFRRAFAARTRLLAEVVKALIVENVCSADEKVQIRAAEKAAQAGPKPTPAPPHVVRRRKSA